MRLPLRGHLPAEGDLGAFSGVCGGLVALLVAARSGVYVTVGAGRITRWPKSAPHESSMSRGKLAVVLKAFHGPHCRDCRGGPSASLERQLEEEFLGREEFEHCPRLPLVARWTILPL
jgi:hypothetical protein